MLLGPLVAPFGEGANRSRGRVEDVDLVALDDLPESVRIRIIGSAFVHQTRSPVEQRTVKNVAVARDPTDVRRTPVRIFIRQVEDVFRREVDVDHVAAGSVHHTFGLSGRAAGIQGEKNVLGVQRLRRAFFRRSFHQLVPPVVSTRFHVYLRSGAAEDDHVANRRGLL